MCIVKIEDLKKIIIPEIITNNKPGAFINLATDKIVSLVNETLSFPITFTEVNRFVLNDLNSIRGRGSHSNNNISELFICLSGSCILEVFDGLKK